MCKADYFPPRTHIPQAYWLTGCLICSPQPTRDSSEFTECAMVKDGGLRIGGGKQNTSMIAGGWGWSVCVCVCACVCVLVCSVLKLIYRDLQKQLVSLAFVSAPALRG